MDAAWGLAERDKQYDLQKAAAHVALAMPYQTASELLEELTKTAMSDHVLPEGVGAVGAALTVLEVAPRAEEIGQRVAAGAAGKGRRPGLVLAIDGAQVPPRPAAEWVEATLARLFLGEGAEVVKGLERMEATSAEAEKAIAGLRGYLEANQQRVDYGRHRRGGYPLGSGAIESAHRFIGQVRLKRSGAWWYVENGNGMLALRCAKYNGTFERVFERYVRREQERRWGRSANST